MCSNYGVISRSDPRFSLLPLPPPSTTTSIHACRRDSFLRLPFKTDRIRFASVKSKAAINDSYVEAPATPISEFMSFYELLGIPETGTSLEIKQAYKQLALKYHPDVSPPDRIEEYTQRFIRVQEAYETLSDPGRRALYDKDMARGVHFAFSARRRYQSDETMGQKSEWKSLWKDQLSELKRRSMHKEAGGGNMSWAARMRRQRNESSS